MKRAVIDKLAGVGFIGDLPSLDLPPGAWSDSRNVRYRDGAVEKIKGFEEAWGGLSVTAIWCAPITDGASSFWVYGSGNAMYATDGSTHADIKGALSLSATDDIGYTGGAFHGFMVVNDSVQIPQVWSPSLGNNLISLTAWPAITCEIIRPWRDFLIALRINDGATVNPRLMRWSDAAPSGGLPASWDFADPTNQSGIKEFGESEDVLIDCEPIRDALVIYKSASTWLAEFVGGADVLGFRQIFNEIGALSQDCIGSFGSQHVVLTGDDLVLHDGNSANSLLDRRARRWLFNRIDTAKYKRCFVTMDHGSREAYICFPEVGESWPTMALIWNWAENTLSPFSLGGPMSSGNYGVITGTASTFDSDSTTFDGDAKIFDEESFSPFKRSLIMTRANKKAAAQFGLGETYNGVLMDCYAERSGTVITEDLGSIKRVWRIWPKIIGSIGDTIVFRLGARLALSGEVQFTGPYSFVIGTDNWIDVRFDARIIDLRVEYSGTGTFRLHGMTVEYDDSGDR